MFGKYEGKINFRHQNVGTNQIGAICIFLKDVRELHAACEASVKVCIEVTNLLFLINSDFS